ncbi:MAG: response regulator [Elusimicrobiaceae bacterium]|nr:response regulator [Elusimicrobiaceae bacterium]
MTFLKMDHEGLKYAFLKIFLSVTTAVLGVTGYIAWERVSYLAKSEKLTELARLENFSFELTDTVSALGARLEMMSDLASMENWLLNPTANNLAALERDIKGFISYGRQFNRAMVFDPAGRELFHVDASTGQSRLTGINSQLLARAQRLTDTQLYVSPVVFMENDAGYQPGLQMIKKIYAGSKLKGFLVCDLNAERLFRRLKEQPGAHKLRSTLFVSAEGKGYLNNGGGKFILSDRYAKTARNMPAGKTADLMENGSFIIFRPALRLPIPTISGKSTIRFALDGGDWHFIVENSEFRKEIGSVILTIAFIAFAFLALLGLVLWRYMLNMYRGEQFERERLASSRELKTIMDSSRDVIIIATDINGTVTQFNTGAENMLGYRAEDIISKHSVTDVFPARSLEIFLRNCRHEDTDISEPELRRKIMTCPDDSNEIAISRRDGSVFSASVTLSHKHDGRGAVSGLVLVGQDISVRKAMQEQIEAANKDLKAIMDSTRDIAILYADQDDTVTHFNSGAERLLGYSADEAIGKMKGLSILHPESLPSLLQDLDIRTGGEDHRAVAQALRRVPDFRRIDRIWRKDGSSFKADVSLFHRYNASGECLGVVLILRDMSEQIAMQENLLRTSRELKSILDSARNVAIIAADKNCVIQLFNTGAEHMLGYSADETIGKMRFGGLIEKEILTESLRAISPGGNTDDPDELCRLVMSMPDIQREIVMQRKNGSRLDVQIVISHKYDADGDTEGLVIVAQDISEIKANQAKRNAAYRELKSVMDSARDVAIISTGASGLITHFNPGAEKIFGYPAAEIIGKRYVGSFATDTAIDMAETELKTTIKHTDPAVRAKNILAAPDFQREIQILRGDGATADLHLMVSHKYDADGIVEGVLIVAQDISVLKKTQADMLTAKEAAESANRAKSEFLANMSHEIRTPLNSIIGISDVMYMSETDQEKRALFQTIQSASESLLQLINDILDFSKIEAGKIDIENIEFDFRDVLENSISFFAAKSGEKGLELVCDIAPDVPARCVGDPGRLKQVLINLLSNAVKFTEHGEIVLRAGRKRLNNDEWVRVEVRDTGIGISKEDQLRIFSKFTQADSSVTRRFGGSGLGLSISKSLVELMGGTLSFESEPGKGSRFYFELPLELPATTEPAELPDFKNISVLIAEDNANNRMVLERTFAIHNISCISAPNGHEVLALLNANPAKFNVVVSDLNMPELDGLALASRIRENPRLKGIKILLLASSGDIPEADLKRYDIAGIISKPVRQTALLSLMASLVSEHRPDAEKNAPAAPAIEIRFPVSVLVAEDNRENANLMHLIFKRLKCPCVIVEDGLKAVEAAKQYRFDLILMDINMPEMDGVTAIKKIRAQETESGSPHVPMIALTAQALKGSREKLIAEGFDDYLPKPVTLFDIRDKLVKWIRPGVLVADDSCDTILLYRMFLKDINVTPFFAASGHDIVEIFKKHSLAIVFSDIEMPGMNGIEAMKTIRQYEAETKAAAPIKLVALSGHEISSQEKLWRDHGFEPDIMLVKPITKPQLLETLRSLLPEIKL